MKTSEVLNIFQNIKSIIAGFGSQWLEVCNMEEANKRASLLNWRVEFFEKKGVCVKFERENIGYQMPANNVQINDFLKKFEKVLKSAPFEMKAKPAKEVEKLESQLLAEKLRLHKRVASIHGKGYKNAMSISFEKETNLTDKIEALSDEIKQKEEKARYLAGKKKGFCWGRKTQADEKRADELSNLKFQLNNILAKILLPDSPQPTARKEVIKPKEVKTIAPKQPIIKPSEVQPDKKLSEILAKLQAGEYLFQYEVTYLQRHGTPPEGYRYNRFAKLERARA